MAERARHSLTKHRKQRRTKALALLLLVSAIGVALLLLWPDHSNDGAANSAPTEATMPQAKASLPTVSARPTLPDASPIPLPPEPSDTEPQAAEAPTVNDTLPVDLVIKMPPISGVAGLRIDSTRPDPMPPFASAEAAGQDLVVLFGVTASGYPPPRGLRDGETLTDGRVVFKDYITLNRPGASENRTQDAVSGVSVMVPMFPTDQFGDVIPGFLILATATTVLDPAKLLEDPPERIQLEANPAEVRLPVYLQPDATALLWWMHPDSISQSLHRRELETLVSGSELQWPPIIGHGHQPSFPMVSHAQFGRDLATGCSTIVRAGPNGLVEVFGLPAAFLLHPLTYLRKGHRWDKVLLHPSPDSAMLVLGELHGTETFILPSRADSVRISAALDALATSVTLVHKDGRPLSKQELAGVRVSARASLEGGGELGVGMGRLSTIDDTWDWVPSVPHLSTLRSRPLRFVATGQGFLESTSEVVHRWGDPVTIHMTPIPSPWTGEFVLTIKGDWEKSLSLPFSLSASGVVGLHHPIEVRSGEAVRVTGLEERHARTFGASIDSTLVNQAVKEVYRRKLGVALEVVALSRLTASSQGKQPQSGTLAHRPQIVKSFDLENRVVTATLEIDVPTILVPDTQAKADANGAPAYRRLPLSELLKELNAVADFNEIVRELVEAANAD